MPHPPFFPYWRPRLAALGRGLAQVIQPLRQATLTQIEERFGSCFSADRLRPAPSGDNSWERVFSLRCTFWCFLWQRFNGNPSCREVVRQVQALLARHGVFGLEEDNSAYCQARKRLPTALFHQALQDTAQQAEQRAPQSKLLQGRSIKLADGTTLTLEDTPANQEKYPQSQAQQKGCGFPLLRLSIIGSLRSGAVLQVAQGNKHQHELRLFQQLLPTLQTDDVLVYDRAGGHSVMAAQGQSRHADLISQVLHRHIDFRKGQRLGKHDRLVTWKKPQQKLKYLTEAEWAARPPEITVRVIRITVREKGYRPQQLLLVTTLLDPVKYPAEEVALAYLRRWRLELCLDDLKTTLGMERLHCKSPALVEKEPLAFLITHNLLRWVMAQAARRQDVPLERISFKGTLDAFRHFSQAMAKARSDKRRRQIWNELLRTLANDLVPERPGRREPRAVKRRPKPYPLLNQPRHQYREIPHRSRYKKAA